MINEQIKDLESKLSKARDLLLSMEIDPVDYKIMKEYYGNRISKLESQLSDVGNDKHSIEELLNRGFDNLINLTNIYLNGSLAEARDLIGLIYPENFTIRETQIQTTRTNKIVESIYLINNELRAKKNGTKEDFSSLSRKVTSTGFKPVTS
ncbi:hypothetical protein FK004_11790 [Flavobacterium kingsejongi]|uniref:Uncharacterized protein n=1 Tax=Flavobacterium kingsejongi TaxID=1678728 RepID=A0A2S1LQ35_9FLAO|nr:hypothetical protein FK004_11790 [Flavobacterium kingsejongi]